MASLALTTKEDVRLFKGWASDADPSDAWIESAITAASARVENSLGRKTLQAAQTEYLDVNPREAQLFLLKGWPILTSPVPVVYHDLLRVFDAGTSINTAHYDFDEALGLLDIDGITLSHGIRVLKVEYTGGMSDTVSNFKTAYPDLAEAVVMQVAFWWESRKRLGQRTVSGPDGSITLEEPLDYLPILRRAISKHKRKFM